MPTSSTSESLRRLGDFELLRELGRGGMGIVYEARQVSLNRKVALKVLSGGLVLTSKAVQRFHREAEAAAKLHHTNICASLCHRRGRRHALLRHGADRRTVARTCHQRTQGERGASATGGWRERAISGR